MAPQGDGASFPQRPSVTPDMIPLLHVPLLVGPHRKAARSSGRALAACFTALEC